MLVCVEYVDFFNYVLYAFHMQIQNTLKYILIIKMYAYKNMYIHIYLSIYINIYYIDKKKKKTNERTIGILFIVLLIHSYIFDCS